MPRSFATLAPLDVRLFLSRRVGDAPFDTPPWLGNLLRIGARCRLKRPAGGRRALWQAMKHHGYDFLKGAPPMDQLAQRACVDGAIPARHALEDARWGAVLQSGLPISVVDADRLAGPWTLRLGEEGEALDGIDLHRVPCVCDDDGPVASPLGDAERAGTSPQTRRALSVVWGAGDTLHINRTTAWYSETLERVGCETLPP